MTQKIYTQDKVLYDGQEYVVALVFDNMATLVGMEGENVRAPVSELTVVSSLLAEFQSAKTAEEFEQIITKAKTTYSVKKPSAKKKAKPLPQKLKI